MINILPEFLLHSANEHPNKIGLIYNNNEYGYQNIEEISNKFANYLLGLGVQRGDRVLIQLGNCAEATFLFWATLKIGAIVCLIDQQLPYEKTKYIIQDSGAKIICINSQETIEHLASDNDLKNLQAVMFANTNSAFAAVNDHSNKLTNRTVLDVDLAAIIYTSGSTGDAKGVMLTHRNMVSAAFSINSYLENTADDIIVSVLPLSFDYGLYQVILAVMSAACLVIEDNFLLPAKLLKTIVATKATVLPGVPLLFSLLHDYAQRFNYDLSSIRYVTNTGAHLSSNNIAKIAKLFPRAKIFSMYGLTECKRCTYLPPADLYKKPNSIGKAIPNTELWLVDEYEQKVPANTIGELVVRGATVMQGYWNKPTETAKKLKHGLAHILHTGDYCYFDDDGYLYFQGRKDDTVKCRGFKVSLIELENLIRTIADVTEVTVIDVSNEAITDLYVFVTLENKASITADFIKKLCQEKLENYKWPKAIIILPELPRSSNGKINKHELRKKITNKIGI